MGLEKIIHALLPRDDKFYLFFEQTAQHLVDASQTMKRLAAAPEAEREALVRHINDFEHLCDTVTHNVFSELSATFVTPFDREDIHLLATALDDIMDFMDEAAGRYILYKVQECPADMAILIDILFLTASEVKNGVHLLRDFRKIDAFKKILEKIHEYENQADKIYERTIADLFEKEKDPIKVIKLKDIYFSLERATDKCEDAANVLETIQIKHA